MTKYPIYKTFWIDEEGKKELEEISKDDGRNESSMLRWLIHQDFERRKRVTVTPYLNETESVTVTP